jgi:hypothetical protein
MSLIPIAPKGIHVDLYILKVYAKSSDYWYNAVFL